MAADFWRRVARRTSLDKIARNERATCKASSCHSFFSLAACRSSLSFSLPAREGCGLETSDWETGETPERARARTSNRTQSREARTHSSPAAFRFAWSHFARLHLSRNDHELVRGRPRDTGLCSREEKEISDGDKRMRGDTMHTFYLLYSRATRFILAQLLYL